MGSAWWRRGPGGCCEPDLGGDCVPRGGEAGGEGVVARGCRDGRGDVRVASGGAGGAARPGGVRFWGGRGRAQVPGGAGGGAGAGARGGGAGEGGALRGGGVSGVSGGAAITVLGEIAEVRGEVSNTAVQLLFAQGTDGDVGGAVGERGAGRRSGGRGGHQRDDQDGDGVGCVVRCGAAAGEVPRGAGSSVGAVGELLVKLYKEAEHLLDLREELGWPADAGAGGEVGAVAAALVERAMLDGADGLVRLLDAVGHDYPTRRRRGAVAGASVRRGAPARGDRSPHACRAREGSLATAGGSRTSPGVAVLEPLGFQARAVVEDVLRTLQRPGEALLPVRLVPERRTAGDERLYATLFTRPALGGARAVARGAGCAEGCDARWIASSTERTSCSWGRRGKRGGSCCS